MQEALKVVGSPRWQNQTGEERTERVPSDEKDIAAEAKKPAPDKVPEPLEAKAYNTPSPSLDTAATTDVSEDAEKSEAEPSAVWVNEQPALMNPGLTVVAACSAIAAIWSYTTLTDTRSQLAQVTAAKTTIERTLSETQAKLTGYEKVLTDIKAAIAGASSGAAAKTAAPAPANSPAK